MTEERFMLPVPYVRLIADQVRSMGGDVPAWLRETGLTEAKLSDPSLTITYPLFHDLVESALTATGEPALGLFVGGRLLAPTHGLVGYAAMASGTTRQALDLFSHYVQLRTSLLSIEQTATGGQVRVRFREARPLGDIRRPVLEAVVMSVKRVLDSISTGACQVSEVAFPFAAPDYAPLARDLFGCEVRYGRAWAGFVLPESAMDLPLTMADPEAFRQTTLLCQRELEKLTLGGSAAARVRRLLLDSPSGFPSLSVAARLVRMTPRTLHRRLIDEGTSYRELLEEIRHALAVEHVKGGKVSMEKVAYALGYSDLANFRRAFKRWEGVSPSAYRDGQRRAVETRGGRRAHR